MMNCICGENDWEWQLDSLHRSWIKCKGCGENMFGEGIGVILINWDVTSISLGSWSLSDVLKANRDGDSVIKDKTCKTCKHFCSYHEIYDFDEFEPEDQGECHKGDYPYPSDKCGIHWGNTCDDFEEEK